MAAIVNHVHCVTPFALTIWLLGLPHSGLQVMMEFNLQRAQYSRLISTGRCKAADEDWKNQANLHAVQCIMVVSV